MQTTSFGFWARAENVYEPEFDRYTSRQVDRLVDQIQNDDTVIIEGQIKRHGLREEELDLEQEKRAMPQGALLANELALNQKNIDYIDVEVRPSLGTMYELSQFEKLGRLCTIPFSNLEKFTEEETRERVLGCIRRRRDGPFKKIMDIVYDYEDPSQNYKAIGRRIWENINYERFLGGCCLVLRSESPRPQLKPSQDYLNWVGSSLSEELEANNNLLETAALQIINEKTTIDEPQKILICMGGHHCENIAEKLSERSFVMEEPEVHTPNYHGNLPIRINAIFGIPDYFDRIDYGAMPQFEIGGDNELFGLYEQKEKQPTRLRLLMPVTLSAAAGTVGYLVGRRIWRWWREN